MSEVNDFRVGYSVAIFVVLLVMTEFILVSPVVKFYQPLIMLCVYLICLGIEYLIRVCINE